MAKKKKSTRSTGGWKAVPDDAIRLSALRWFALTIEKSAIELYATNAASYVEIEKVLRKALTGLGDLRPDFATADPDDCPNGYFLCTNGLCQPSCEWIAEPADSD